MTILGKKQEQETEKQIRTEVTCISRVSNEKYPLEKALAISGSAHVVLAVLLLLLPFILMLLGINLNLFERPKPKVKDIEFVLVNQPDEKPINPRTKHRAKHNSRAGGKHDPKKAVAVPEPIIPKSVARSSGGSQSIVKPRKTVGQRPQRHAAQPQQQHRSTQSAQVPPRPMPIQAIPRPKFNFSKGFPIPAPVTRAPKTIASGGPVTSGPVKYGSPDSSPTPVMSGGYGNSTGTGKGRHSSGSSRGGGQAGNPDAGNANGRPGIDAVREPNWGPYMSELQRRIKRNWDPPRGNESKRVVLMFRIARDGRLLSLSISKSSGNTEADKAAMAAVDLAAPFAALPPEYKGRDIPIQFTFDYNVFNVAGRHF